LSDEEIAETLEQFMPEFTDEEIEQATLKLNGRPTNRTREIRELIEQARKLQGLVKIIDSGILERLPQDQPTNDVMDNQIKDIKKEKKPNLKQLFDILKSKTQEEMIENLSKIGGAGIPIVAIAGILFIAEKQQIKRRNEGEEPLPIEIPEIIHGIINITKLFNTMLNAINILLVTLTEFIGDASIEAIGQKIINPFVGVGPVIATKKLGVDDPVGALFRFIFKNI